MNIAFNIECIKIDRYKYIYQFNIKWSPRVSISANFISLGRI